MEKLSLPIRPILWRILPMMLLVALLLGGCVAPPALSDHRATGGVAELRWVSGGVTVCATVEYAPPSESGSRDVTLRFSAPSSLSDVTLSRKGGDLTCEASGMIVNHAPFYALMSAADLLCAEGILRYVSRTELEGMECFYAEIQPNDEEKETVGLWIDPHTLTPRQIKGEELTLTVLSLKIHE